MKLKTGKIMASYAFLSFTAYFIVAVFEISGIYLQRDIFGGFALIIVSITFLAGIKDTWNSSYKGLSFILGGLILAGILGIMYIFILFANLLEWLIGEAPYPSAIRAEIFLLLFIMPLFILAYMEIRRIK